jgi:Family of unknown function (DUF6074)
MNVNVVPFPLSRRKAFVWRHATIINGMSPESAKRHLAHQFKVQYDALKRRGIAEDRINGELASLKRAILATSERESTVAHEQ